MFDEEKKEEMPVEKEPVEEPTEEAPQMEEKRGFTIQGCKCHLTLTELRTKLEGTPTKHVLAVWDQGARA